MSRKAIQGLMILALATVGSITSPAFAQSDATAPGTVITQSTDGLSLAEFGELQANFARTAGTAIVAAQSCPGVQLDGAELEIVGAPLGVTIEELLSSIIHEWRLIYGPLLVLLVLYAKGGLNDLLTPKSSKAD